MGRKEKLSGVAEEDHKNLTVYKEAEYPGTRDRVRAHTAI